MTARSDEGRTLPFEEAAQVLLQRTLDAVTASGMRQALADTRQVDAVGSLLTGLYEAETGREEPSHLGELWQLLLFLNDRARRRPRLRVVVDEGADRARVIDVFDLQASQIHTRQEI